MSELFDGFIACGAARSWWQYVSNRLLRRATQFHALRKHPGMRVIQQCVANRLLTCATQFHALREHPGMCIFQQAPSE